LGNPPEQDDPYAGERVRMVREQIERRGVSDPRVLRAMESVPRHLFVPESFRTSAHDDGPLPIGEGQTISQPYIVAFMSEAIRPRPTDRVLEIGFGPGLAIAELAGRAGRGRVYGIDHSDVMVHRASRRNRAAIRTLRLSPFGAPRNSSCLHPIRSISPSTYICAFASSVSPFSPVVRRSNPLRRCRQCRARAWVRGRGGTRHPAPACGAKSRRIMPAGLHRRN